MPRTTWTPSLALVAILLALVAYASLRSDSAAQSTPTLAVDTATSGNSATSLGPIDGCVEVKTGDTFSIDIGVTDVVDLFHWEMTFVYDREVLEVVDRDIRMFLNSELGSKLIVDSDSLPDGDGSFFLGAVDISHATESGSGVLARLTLKAIAAGVSEASVPQIDWFNTGTINTGPILEDRQQYMIGDVTGDQFFDGPTSHALVAVGQSCAGLTPIPPTLPPSPPPHQGSGDDSVIIDGEEDQEEENPPASSPVPEGEGGEPPPEGEGGEPPPEESEEETARALAEIETAPPGPDEPSSPEEAGEGGRSSGDGLPPWLIGVIAIGIVVLGGASLLTVRHLRR